jgi:hypothetical protein
MSEAEGFYINSNMKPGGAAPPKAAPEPIEVRREGTEDRLVYPSAIAAGMEVVDVPRRGFTQSGRPCDTVPVRALGPYVAQKCEAALERGDGATELAWHLGNAKGAGLIDSATARRLDQFVDGLANAPDQRVYFNDTIKPILYGLRPAPRGPRGANE